MTDQLHFILTETCKQSIERHGISHLVSNVGVQGVFDSIHRAATWESQSVATELQANEDECKQIIAGCLGMM